MTKKLNESINSTEAVVEQTLAVQSSAVERLSNKLTIEEITSAARVIDNSGDQVVLAGIGKSGDVARKITATFNSIGVSSNFLHPVEALHGDLGVISQDDVAILISNSGNTDEMVELLQVLSPFNPTTIAITSDSNSRLGTSADYHIDTRVDEEGAVIDLVPMASTTATMAIGDCIANVLMNLQQFEKEDFGYLHPGGTIGKQLLLSVSDVMHEEIPRTNPSDTLAQVAVKMSEGGKGIAVVQDNDEHVLGILTDGDIRRLIESGVDFYGEVARDVMIENPITISLDEPAIRALRIIEDNNITQLIVVENDNTFQGIVHFHDIIQEGLST